MYPASTRNTDIHEAMTIRAVRLMGVVFHQIDMSPYLEEYMLRRGVLKEYQFFVRVRVRVHIHIQKCVDSIGLYRG